MKWIKWYPIEWLHSTCRDELLPAERATFHDYVCLAALQNSPGKFKFSSNESLARQLNTPIEIIQSTNQKCIKNNRIQIEKDDLENCYYIIIPKWKYYQSTYSPQVEHLQSHARDVNKKNRKPKKALTKFDARIEENRIEEEKKDTKVSSSGKLDHILVSNSKKAVKKERKIYSIPYERIIDFLNVEANTQYRPQTKATQKLIKARYNEGFTFQDFKFVIKHKTTQWKDNSEMLGYLRPQTLFGTKFEAYLNEAKQIWEDEDEDEKDQRNQ